MVFSIFALRLLKLMVLGLGKAGVGCGRFWGWVVLLVGVSLGSARIWAQPGMYKTVSTERSSQKGATPFEARRAMHEEEAWLNVAAHLPNPKTASADALEMAGDVLRARRYPDDAVDFYTDALIRGGDAPRLLNKLGVTEIGLRHTDQARGYLKLAIKRDKKDAEAWNNLGATEYMDGRMRAATSAYRRALKLKPGSAVFHGNLATALMEDKDFDGARKELAKAMDLDPEFGTRHDSEGGISAHILAPADRARYCFEMARVYAAKGQIDLMLHSLAMASENGLDLREKMAGDAELKGYLVDARVVLLIQNAKAMALGKPTMEALAGTAGVAPTPTPAVQ